LLYEYKKQNEDALNIWTKIQTKDACERTVAILKKLESKDYIKRYAKWIFSVEPEIGLKLFTDETKSSG